MYTAFRNSPLHLTRVFYIPGQDLELHLLKVGRGPEFGCSPFVVLITCDFAPVFFAEFETEKDALEASFLIRFEESDWARLLGDSPVCKFSDETDAPWFIGEPVHMIH